MTGLPKEIHIKQRKRGRDNETDDTPNFLQLDNEFSSKRRMSSKFVYQRRTLTGSKLPSFEPTSPPAIQAPPVIRTSKPGHGRNGPKQSGTPTTLNRQAKQHGPPMSDAPVQPEGPFPSLHPTSSTNSKPPTAARPQFQPRSFHLSRSSINASSSRLPKPRAQGISKHSRYGTVVFVERGGKKSSSPKKKVPENLVPDRSLGRATTASVSEKEAQDTEMHNAPGPALSFKKPNAKRLAPRPSTDALVKSAAPAPPATKPETAIDTESKKDVDAQRKPLPEVAPIGDPSKIAADMDQWVLHEIGLNIKEMDIQQQKPPKSSAIPTTTPSTPSKPKPKAPAQRFAQRNPELACQLDAQGRRVRNGANGESKAEDGGLIDYDDPMEDADADNASDDDYEIVVYQLAPRVGSGPALTLGSIPPEEIGILKFDSKEDMELFYGNEDDDEDYDPDDEEDENAENHYTAEYPEELDSDDSEFDGRDGNGIRGGMYGGLDDSDNDDTGLESYYRPDAEYDSDDEENDRYIVEGDNKSRDQDDVFQEHIRRYIRRHGGG